MITISWEQLDEHIDKGDLKEWLNDEIQKDKQRQFEEDMEGVSGGKAGKMSDIISRQAAIEALRAAYWDKNIQSAKDDPCIVDAMTDWAICTKLPLLPFDRRDT